MAVRRRTSNAGLAETLSPAPTAPTTNPKPALFRYTPFETLPRILAREGYASFEGGKMWEGTFAQAGFTHGMATSIGSLYESVGDGFGREGRPASTNSVFAPR
jgi:hypothetical protein